MYKTVISITQQPRLVEVKVVETKTTLTTVKPDGTLVSHEPVLKTATTEKWSVKAMVDPEWAPVKEEEFFFPGLAACEVIKPGYRQAY